MNLTFNERVILAHLLEIQRALQPKDAKYYDEQLEIVRSGYTVFYEQLTCGVYAQETGDDICKFVLDVLSLYRAIEDYKTNNPKDADVAKHRWGFFHGFDGNNETEFMAFARFLFEEQGKFSEQAPYRTKNDKFNSHMETVPKHTAMLGEWRKRGGNYDLSRDDIMAIIDAG